MDVMKELLRGKAKHIETGQWLEGNYYYYQRENKAFILPCDPDDLIRVIYTEDKCVDIEVVGYEVNPDTFCFSTGKVYMNGELAYSGDIFESQSCGLKMVIKYGTYQAYCPEDKSYMDSVGFYAEAEGYSQMPIGDLNDYALKIGNIYDNPELLKL